MFWRPRRTASPSHREIRPGRITRGAHDRHAQLTTALEALFIQSDVTDVLTIFTAQGSEDVWLNFVDGWATFGDWQVLTALAVNVLLAAALAWPLGAFRPKRTYYRQATLEDLESPRYLVMLATISAAIAVLVVENSYMALVVFGMGGLLRFRTPTGSVKATLQSVGAVVIGLACGLSLYALALVLSVLFLALGRGLTAAPIVQLRVRGLNGDARASMDAFRAALDRLGCRVEAERPDEAKGEFTVLFGAPPGMDLRELEERAVHEVPKHLRGDRHDVEVA